jgi:hypothetical protein
MAAELVYHLAILVAVRPLPCMGAIDSRCLRSDSYFRMQHFVRRATYIPFRGFLGENSCNVFLLLFMVLWLTIAAMLCRRAVLMLWHAFLFHGLRFFSFFSSFCLVLSAAFYCKNLY